MNVGFIGLGIMGKPMVLNLLKNGYEVKAFDLNEQARKEVVEAGGKEANNLLEATNESNVIITMLPNAAIVKQVLLGENGVYESIQEGAVVIDMSSISPVDSQYIAGKFAEKGVAFLDAPVSGGEPKAIDGTMSIMVGGEEDALTKVLPVLKAMGEEVTYVGGSGSGTTTKLANQILVNVTIAAMSEAVVLASKAGIDVEKMYQAIRGGLAGSAVLDAKMPLVLERNFVAGGRIDINLKDLTNVLEAGHAIGVPMPLTSNVVEMFHALKVDGKAADDHGGLVQYYEKLANFKIPVGGKEIE
ncbi:2-hydroxy-3-oxopropionate reductase [Sporosarcina sp. Marseille-Q4063]|uniref:2-hydroxy-3-oxopropionate reductase n=1 Tax=Sporosarcina sp. Marseille-Q4063 TaxID=2810514 RepID=UPI001BAF80BA|nr:2-hydroxy-3-oxopropionate reductase [Sporosarcina sp. Marseille-Q4063]QUW21450.1 2-hydroxy-3-oxopropionate reductase [Sporosarcina sp. Marseille-Q4063]